VKHLSVGPTLIHVHVAWRRSRGGPRACRLAGTGQEGECLPTKHLLLLSVAGVGCCLLLFRSWRLSLALDHIRVASDPDQMAEKERRASSWILMLLMLLLGLVVRVVEAAINSKPHLRVVQLWFIEEPASAAFCFGNATITA